MCQRVSAVVYVAQQVLVELGGESYRIWVESKQVQVEFQVERARQGKWKNERASQIWSSISRVKFLSSCVSSCECRVWLKAVKFRFSPNGFKRVPSFCIQAGYEWIMWVNVKMVFFVSNVWGVLGFQVVRMVSGFCLRAYRVFLFIFFLLFTVRGTVTAVSLDTFQFCSIVLTRKYLRRRNICRLSVPIFAFWHRFKT